MALPPVKGVGSDRKKEPAVALPPVKVVENRPRDPAPRPPAPAPAPAPVRPPVPGPREHVGPVPGMGSTPNVRQTPYMQGAYKYVTPGGHKYSLQMRPRAAQEAVISQIVDYGFSLGVPEETIAIAVVTAYQESSWGDKVTNSESSALGVFQFTAPTWKDYEHLDRASLADQLVVVYGRINDFRSNYEEVLSKGTIPKTMTFPEYAYANHKQGTSKPQEFATNPTTQKALRSFWDNWLILSLHVE